MRLREAGHLCRVTQLKRKKGRVERPLAFRLQAHIYVVRSSKSAREV
jgi:hypothetical protein